MYNYPYPMIFPPQPPQDPKLHEIHERAYKLAEKMLTREAREKERAENRKRSLEKEARKEGELRRARSLLFIEWYILGILSYPLWEPAYRALIAYTKTIQ